MALVVTEGVFLFADCSKSTQRNATIVRYNKSVLMEDGTQSLLRLQNANAGNKILPLLRPQAGHSK